MPEGLAVRFNEVSNGWLEVQIQTEEILLNFRASNVPYDSIYELTKGLYIFANTGVTQIIKWNTEPIEFEFLFTKFEGQTSFEIVDYPDNRRLKGTGECKLIMLNSLEAIIIPFWRALKELSNFEGFEQHWKHKFPEQELKLLTGVVKSL